MLFSVGNTSHVGIVIRIGLEMVDFQLWAPILMLNRDRTAARKESLEVMIFFMGDTFIMYGLQMDYLVSLCIFRRSGSLGALSRMD